MSLFRRKTLTQATQESSMHEHSEEMRLSKNLTLKDLTSFGIAAIIGAGIFATIGNASAAGGPAVSLLFLFTAIACLFSALCYAQFASNVPIAGSAYTYAYISFGELIAWIIGWDLLMEYAIGNIAVAISWSDYFTGLMEGLGFMIPEYMTMDYLSAHRGWYEVNAMMAEGISMEEIPNHLRLAYLAWEEAPRLGSLRIIFDFPALCIIVIVTTLVYVGIKESKKTANVLVVLKIIVLILFIAVGAFYVNPSNWSPFAPNGMSGVLKGVSAVFFAYIGFDAISTTAEESRSPRRDLPRAMLYALLICTVLYVVITLVLTGMVSYSELAVGDPLAFAFSKVGLETLSGIIAVSAVIAMTGVLLVFQLGQPRIWMSMSRDGLLPEIFSRIHPRYRTPSFSTVLTGFFVAIPAMFMNLTEVTDLCSIGTLFAFILVCGGILMTDKNRKDLKGFRVPYINGKYIIPALIILVISIIHLTDDTLLTGFFVYTGWEDFQHKIPMLVFVIVCLLFGYFTFINNLSLIPVLGLLTNFYLMTELGITNWGRFLLWLALGLIIYFIYGYRKSRLALKENK